jgi:hypothetical protein
MSDTYNGWTNYATWRVNLEMFDSEGYNFDTSQEAYDLSHDLRNYAEDYIEDTTQEGLGRDYALAFLSDVDWYEIAKHMKEEQTA